MSIPIHVSPFCLLTTVNSVPMWSNVRHLSLKIPTLSSHSGAPNVLLRFAGRILMERFLPP